jgi:hypothetical protein
MTGIVFDTLTDSPDTPAAATVNLPPLQVRAYGAAGNHGIAKLPALSVVATGFVTERWMGDAIVTLPPLGARAYGAAGGHAIVTLPALAVRARDAGVLAPNPGNAVCTLPHLQVVATGFERCYGSAIVNLPALSTRAVEASGASAIVVLPSLSAVALEQALPSTPRGLLLMPSGFMASFASLDYLSRLEDTATFGMSSTGVLTALLQLRLRLDADPHTAYEGFGQLVDTLELDDQLAVIFTELLTVSMALGATHTVTRIAIAEMVDALLLGAHVATAQEAYALIVEALAFGSLLEAVNIATFTAGMAFDDAIAAAYTAAAALVDSLMFGVEQTPTVTFAALLRSDLALSMAGLSAWEAFGLLEDRLDFVVQLNIDDEQYLAWTMNTTSKAATRYDSWPFNSFMRINGKRYGVAATGLYRIGGATDNGEDINAKLRLGMSSLGTRVLKRIPEIYYATAGGDLYFKVIVAHEKTGERSSHGYRGYTVGGASMREGRIEPGRGLKSVYFDFQIENIDGSSFDLDVLEFKPLLLDRRVRGKAGAKP